MTKNVSAQTPFQRHFQCLHNFSGELERTMNAFTGRCLHHGDFSGDAKKALIKYDDLFQCAKNSISSFSEFLKLWGYTPMHREKEMIRLAKKFIHSASPMEELCFFTTLPVTEHFLLSPEASVLLRHRQRSRSLCEDDVNQRKEITGDELHDVW